MSSSSDPMKPRPTGGSAPASGSGRPSAAPAAQRGAASASSMLPPRSRASATPAPPNAPGARGPGPKPIFKPVIPVRRRPQATPTPAPSSSAPASNDSTPSTRGSGRGTGRGTRGGRGAGGRGGTRPPPDVVASGPFAMGTGAQRAGRSAASRGGNAISANYALSGPSVSGSGNAGSSDLKPDPSRLAYRSPDKLAEREEYSDQEVEIVDMDDVAALDENAPRSLPRLSDYDEDKTKRKKKKAKAKSEGPDVAGLTIKADPDDEIDLIGNGTESTAKAKRAEAMPEVDAAAVDDDDESVEADEEHDGLDTANALDLSESEDEEIQDDLIDDFVTQEGETISPENRIYLFQFPSVFPKFVAMEPKPTKKSDGRARRVLFADDVTGKAGSDPEKDKDKSNNGKGVDSDKKDSGVEDTRRRHTSGTDIAANVQNQMDNLRNGPGGRIGRLDIYHNGQAQLRMPRTAKKAKVKKEEDIDMDLNEKDTEKGKEADVSEVLEDLVMDLTAGSQPTFLQHLMLRDGITGASMTFGEIHRKFVVAPELNCLLDDPEDLPVVKEEPGTGKPAKSLARPTQSRGLRVTTSSTSLRDME